MAKSYNEILQEYPEYITKDQFYQICHVSKKTALYYLESGLIPCVDSGKKTEARLTRWLKGYPDLIKSTDISKITGYSLKTVFAWCSAGKLHCFRIRKAILAPKLSFIDFMMSDDFQGIKVMKENYAEFLESYAGENVE